VQVRRLGGEDAWVLVHIDVRSQEESDFAQRMHMYYWRICDRY
jgi:hypothetical protein